MLQYIKNTVLGNGQTSKLRTPVFKTPSYLNRYLDQNKKALVISTGPSLTKHLDDIKTFIKREQPIVFGCNNIHGVLTPDYHVFSNRRRFGAYGKDIHPDSTPLLSPYFTHEQIQKVLGDRDYEEIMLNIDPLANGEVLKIEQNIICSHVVTVAVVACSVAHLMGLDQIFIAGMDGYSINPEKSHHYQENDNKEMDELLKQEKLNIDLLDCLQDEHLKKRGGVLNIITPTAYDKFYNKNIL